MTTTTPTPAADPTASAPAPASPRDRLRDLLRYWVKILVIWCPLATLLFAVALGDLRALPRRWLVAMIIGIVTATICFWGVNLIAALHRMVARRLGRPPPRHGHLWNVLLSALLMPLGMWAGFAAAASLGPLFGYRLGTPDFSDYRSGILLGLIIVGWFFFLETRRDAETARQQAELRLKEVDNQRLRVQLAALTTQMNPHLLFNALNTIASLIPSDPEVAEEMTVQLSELLRGVLTATGREVHALADELAICGAYLAVEQARFGDRLRASVTVADDVDPAEVQLPVLTIQPLVENAIKYAVAPRVEGGAIALGVARGDDGDVTITISDDGPGPGKAKVAGGAGVGIDNCRARLALHYGASDAGSSDRTSAAGAEDLLRMRQRPAGGTEVLVKLPAAAMVNEAIKDAQETT